LVDSLLLSPGLYVGIQDVVYYLQAYTKITQANTSKASYRKYQELAKGH